MRKILIYLGENIKFDVDSTIEAINSIDGVREGKVGNLIGAVFECNYGQDGLIIRISSDCETITIDGDALNLAEFMIKLQNVIPEKLFATDMDYAFNIEIWNFSSAGEMLSAMNSI